MADAYFNRKTQAEVLVFSLVTEIDRLIVAYSEVVDDPIYMDESTGIMETTVKSPWIEFPDIWNWGSFPTKLQYRIRTIPNQIYLANKSVSSLWKYGDGLPDYYDAFEERTYRFALIGLEAVEINDILAKEYGVPLLDRGLRDPEERFSRDIDKITQRRDEEKANPRPTVPWMWPLTPIEELNARYAKLTLKLATAQKKKPASTLEA